MKTASVSGIYQPLPDRLAHLASRLNPDPWNNPVFHGRVHLMEDERPRQADYLDVDTVVSKTPNSVFALGGMGGVPPM